MSGWRYKDKILLADSLGTTLSGLHAIYASDIEFNIESETDTDEVETAHSGASLQVYYGQHVSLNFKTPLAMCGTAGSSPAIAPLLLACGMVQVSTASSVTFTKGAATKAKCMLRFGSNTHEISEMLGNVSMSLEKGIPKLNWQFKGLFSPPIHSITAPTVDWARWKRPEVLGVACNSAFKLNNTARTLHKLTIDVGNNVIFDRAINHEEIMLTGHESKAQMTLSADTIANFNPFDATGDIQNFEFSHGTSAGNKFTVLGRFQMPVPKYASLESELAGYELDGSLVPSGAGYDELTLVFE
ncbi:hypothetical protein J8L98_22065 [Pseudoalteromonas sp. MMG013]|uniref:hypothetical protein n=1 Tax=Pseudoalteromonas sp. MMG013 TaxID=2822687 RepID=UPI001B358FF0|nr:hypothetical protein [Pseudoalteromonas sp. MMG013]MBQ4864381.1 hypothetical protein [Pseudoalteromonas sp. MMG013]